MTSLDVATTIPDIKTEKFEGPLDLLCYLIEKNKINIYDIPIEQVADQYIEYLSQMTEINLEVTSEFLVMASTLLMIKSRMLLPSPRSDDSDDGFDPREELVLKILEYRRCKALADFLKEKHDRYIHCYYKMPEPIKSLGISPAYNKEIYDREMFYDSAKALASRNSIRFFDVSNKMAQLLQREKISVKEKMKLIWEKISNKTKVFFNELFPKSKTSRGERVSGFLALLEMLRTDVLNVEQLSPFDIITIERKPETSKEVTKRFEKLFDKKAIEEIEYK